MNPHRVFDEVDLEVVCSVGSEEIVVDPEWCGEWACRTDSEDMPPLHWPDDMGPEHEPIQIDHFKKALLSFPTQLGLGWDKVHPMAISRLEDSIIMAIIRLLMACERLGKVAKQQSLDHNCSSAKTDWWLASNWSTRMASKDLDEGKAFGGS